MAASLPLQTPKVREGGRTAHLERVVAESMGAKGMWVERIIQRLPTADDRVAPAGVTEADTCLHAEAPESSTLWLPMALACRVMAALPCLCNGLETPLATEARKVDFRFRGVENVRVYELGLEKLFQGFEQGIKIDTGAEMYVHNQPKELPKDNHIKNVNYGNYFLRVAGGGGCDGGSDGGEAEQGGDNKIYQNMVIPKYEQGVCNLSSFLFS